MIGSSIAHRLVELGAEVRIADARIAPYGANDFNLKGIEEKIELFQGPLAYQDGSVFLKNGEKATDKQQQSSNADRCSECKTTVVPTPSNNLGT